MCIRDRFYDYDKSTVLYSEEVLPEGAVTLPESPKRSDTVTDTSVISYAFFEWRDCLTDSPAGLDAVDRDMDVYAAYTESVTYTTKLTLEYYTIADLEKGVYDTVPYETVVTDYNEEIKTSSYIPEDIVIHTATAAGFDNTQTWSFDKWLPDTEYQLTGRFTGTDNVTIKLYSEYKLAGESYVNKEPEDIEEAEETEKAEETVKTGDDMTARMYIWLFVLSAALTGIVTTVSRQAYVRKK